MLVTTLVVGARRDSMIGILPAHGSVGTIVQVRLMACFSMLGRYVGNDRVKPWIKDFWEG